MDQWSAPVRDSNELSAFATLVLMTLRVGIPAFFLVSPTLACTSGPPFHRTLFVQDERLPDAVYFNGDQLFNANAIDFTHREEHGDYDGYVDSLPENGEELTVWKDGVLLDRVAVMRFCMPDDHLPDLGPLLDEQVIFRASQIRSLGAENARCVGENGTTYITVDTF